MRRSKFLGFISQKLEHNFWEVKPTPEIDPSRRPDRANARAGCRRNGLAR
jgi:hypothetical protein